MTALWLMRSVAGQTVVDWESVSELGRVSLGARVMPELDTQLMIGQTSDMASSLALVPVSFDSV